VVEGRRRGEEGARRPRVSGCVAGGQGVVEEAGINFLQAAREPWQRIKLLHATKAMEKRCPEKFCICEEKRLFFLRSAVATQGLPSNILFQVWWSRKKRVR